MNDQRHGPEVTEVMEYAEETGNVILTIFKFLKKNLNRMRS